jgi:hypothetical protein
MKKYFFNFTNKQIVPQPNYQPTNETISDFGFRISEYCYFALEMAAFRNPKSAFRNSITHFFGANLIKKKQ